MALKILPCSNHSPPARITPSLPLITLLPPKIFPNSFAANAPNKIAKKPYFCSFASFSIVSLTPFINKPGSLRDLTIFKISFISSFEIISVVMPDPKNFFLTVASGVDVVFVYPNGIRTLSASGMSTFFIKGSPFLIMDQEN